MHWREAQRQQDEDYTSIDLEAFARALDVWQAEFEAFQADAQAYDETFAMYEQSERQYYLDTCGIPPL